MPEKTSPNNQGSTFLEKPGFNKGRATDLEIKTLEENNANNLGNKRLARLLKKAIHSIEGDK